jgi:hypothetical protein
MNNPEKLATEDDETRNKNTSHYVLDTTIANKPK